MVAVVDGGFRPPDQQRSDPALHRLVAVAVRPDELRADADLVRRISGVARVDLLLVTDGDGAGEDAGAAGRQVGEPGGAGGVDGVDGADGAEGSDDPDGSGDPGSDGPAGSDDPDDPDDPDTDDPDGPDHPGEPDAGAAVGALARERVAALGLTVDVHRLALHLPALPAVVRPRDVEDVVAAISELVGFDPEPGVGCVVPAGALQASRQSGPADAVVGRAVQRIVAAYGLPLLTYVPLSR